MQRAVKPLILGTVLIALIVLLLPAMISIWINLQN